jgi:hypothetical protein
MTFSHHPHLYFSIWIAVEAFVLFGWFPEVPR